MKNPSALLTFLAVAILSIPGKSRGLPCQRAYEALFLEPPQYSALGESWLKIDPLNMEALAGQTVALGVRPVSPFFTHAIAGKASLLEISPDYPVLKIEDAAGRIHYIDPKYIRSARRHDPKRPGSPDLKDLASHERELMALDHKRLKSLLCAQRKMRQSDPSHDRLKSLVSANYRNSRQMSLFLAARCGISLAAFYPLRTAFRQYRAGRRTANDRDVVTEHGSNFVTGLLYMSMVHGCLASLTGDQKRVFLTLTAGANIAGNVWEEIDIPGVPQKSLPIFTSAGNEVKTDLGDFASGLLSTATYVAGTLVVEKALGIAISQLCL